MKKINMKKIWYFITFRKIKEVKEVKIPDSMPIIINVKNSSDKTQKCSLFGYNKNIHENNCNNPKELNLSCHNDVSYKSVVSDSAFRPFTVGFVRINSNNSKNLECTLDILTENPNGSLFKEPLPLTIVKDPCQFQNDVISFNENFKIDNRVSINFDIEPKSEMLFVLFPVSISNNCNNKKKYNTPNIIRPRFKQVDLDKPKNLISVIDWFKNKYGVLKKNSINRTKVHKNK